MTLKKEEEKRKKKKKEFSPVDKYSSGICGVHRLKYSSDVSSSTIQYSIMILFSRMYTKIMASCLNKHFLYLSLNPRNLWNEQISFFSYSSFRKEEKSPSNHRCKWLSQMILISKIRCLLSCMAPIILSYDKVLSMNASFSHYHLLFLSNRIKHK
jgi:hypothetical protein